MFDALNRPNRPSSARASEIKSWVCEVFHLTEDTTVLVTELRCSEPECPPIETVLAVFADAGKPIQHKILKPMDGVLFDDIVLLTTQSARPCNCPLCDDSW